MSSVESANREYPTKPHTFDKKKVFNNILLCNVNFYNVRALLETENKSQVYTKRTSHKR